MDSAEIELLLRQWGYYYGEPIVERRSRVPESTISKARQFAPGKKDKRQATRRAGFSRRRYMAKNAGLTGLLPTAFVDPIPAPREHHSGGGGRSGPGPAPPDVQRLNREINELEQFDLLRGLCLRAQYCSDDARTERCHWVTEQFRRSKRDAELITEAKFKNEVAFAKVWLLARLSDPRLRAPG